MKRNARARWQGGLKNGRGTLTTDSSVLSDTPYSFATRFENAAGSNPEELIAAAHAGCFSMALSMILGEAGVEPEQIDTRATVTIEQQDGGFAIPAVHLATEVRAPGLEEAAFREAAEQAKLGCPVSKVLRAEITLDAKLTG